MQNALDDLIIRAREFTDKTAAQWSKLVQEFFDMERKFMLEKTPTAKDLADHRLSARVLIQTSHFLLAISDPEKTDPRLIDELEGRLIQLKHSWRQFQEPMDEANRIIKQHFPE